MDQTATTARLRLVVPRAKAIALEPQVEKAKQYYNWPKSAKESSFDDEGNYKYHPRGFSYTFIITRCKNYANCPTCGPSSATVSAPPRCRDRRSLFTFKPIHDSFKRNGSSLRDSRGGRCQEQETVHGGSQTATTQRVKWQTHRRSKPTQDKGV